MVSVAASNVFLYGFRRGKERFLMVSVVARERFLMVSVVAGNVFLFFMVSVVFFKMVSVVARNDFLWFPSLVFLNGFRLLQDRGCLSDGNRKKTTRTFPRRTKHIYIYIYIYIYINNYFYILNLLYRFYIARTGGSAGRGAGRARRFVFQRSTTTTTTTTTMYYYYYYY